MFAHSNWISVRKFATTTMMALGLGAFMCAPGSTAQTRITVSVSPASASVQVGTGTQQFTATVRRDWRNRGVLWTLSGAGCTGSACGTLSATSSASGTPITYRAPSTVPTPATVKLTATSVSNSTRSATATITVTVTSSVSVTISPTSASLNVSSARQFTAAVTNDSANQGVTWSLAQSGSNCAPACGALSGQTATTVTYTAPATVPVNPTVTLTARSVRDTSKSASATITVTSPVSVTIFPTSASLNVSATQQFTASVANDTANQGVTWALSQSGSSCAPACGALSGQTATTVTYAAPATVPVNPTVTLTARSVRDTSKSASATITVTSPVSVTIFPTSASLNVSATQQFTASVANDTGNQGVTWDLSQSGSSCAPACGALSAQTATTVTYTAPATVPANPTVTLTARSVRDTSKSASATITVTSSGGSVSVTMSPKRGGLAVAQTLAITATVINDVGNAGVTWSASGSGCSGSACGTFTNTTTASATYVAPPAAGVYTLTATSAADVTRSASATIAVTDLPGVLTYHNNLLRDGSNIKEYALTTALVTTTTFGKLFSCQADGAIYTQPLWVPRVTISGMPHNVIVVATQHNSVYAFDADASPCTTLWHTSLLDSAHGGTANETSVPSGATGGLVGNGFGDITPEVGVTGTPVIDPSTNTIYVVSKSVNPSTQFFQRLHALEL